jgi:type II secretory ATPase GspE/PulE/Tfp pilus assembly ATPase PilB-like protein
MSVVDLSKETVDRSILEGFPVRLMHRHGIFPIDRSSSSIRIVVSNPFDVQAADAVSAATGLFVMTILLCLTKSRLLIKTHLGVGAQTLDGLMAQAAENTDEIEILGDLSFEESEAAAMAQQASVVRLVNDILTEAVTNRASDIHMEVAGFRNEDSLSH